MPLSTSAAPVYDLVVQGFRDLGATNPEWVECSILLRSGYCVGRGYRNGPLRAYWLLEEEHIEFYDAAGTLAMCVDLSSEGQERAAA